MEANNTKAVREGLERLLNLAYEVQDANSECEYGPQTSVPTQFIIDVAKSALAAPPRNCDVGTSEDQGERFKNFCRNHQFISVDSEDGFPPVYVCSNESCPLHDYYIAHGEDNCELAWAQMPYEKGDNDGGK